MTARVIALVCALALAVIAAGPVHARSIGQAIDDAAIVAQVKAKLTADQLSNLVRIEVNSTDGVVTLSGTVDTPERRDRIVQIASWVKGVKQVVNDIRVSGEATSSTVATSPSTSPMPSGSARVDATGNVATVDRTTGALALADGRVVRVTDGTLIWQATTVEALRPGTQVMIRNGTQGGVEGRAAGDWRMGTVRSVDRTAGRLTLTDGTVVRVTPSTIVQRGTERLTLDALQPGSEIVVRTSPAPAVEASQIDVVWSPTARTR
jgi:BON domain